ncbi:MAG: M48 family metalloprotease [Kofleriaceae bacterium]
MRNKAALLLVLAIACGERRFLGEPVGNHCADYLTCVAWARDRAMRTAGRLSYDDPALLAYVQGVMDRLVRASGTAIRPEVVITEVGSTATAVIGDRVYMDRTALAALDSEDELAAILAHELAHLDADHPGQLDVDDDVTWRLDMESAADERAIGILRAADYAPTAMLSMLDAIGRGATRDDDEHPTALQRRARTALLIGDAPPRALRREPYRRRLDGLVLGEDPRFVMHQDGTLFSLAVDVALELPQHKQEEGTLNATLVERGRGDDLERGLERRRVHQLAGKRVITGLMPEASTVSSRELSQLDRVFAEEIAHATQTPVAGAHVILIRGRRDLVIQLTGNDLDGWTTRLLREIRTPTAAERATIEPYRLRYVPARIGGTYAEVAKRTCASYDQFSLLDAPARQIARGERIKCAIKR